MQIKIIFKPESEQERAATKLLNIPVDRCDGEIYAYGDPERQKRLLGALIDILKLSIVP